ncbi:MAG: hypothetical protein JSU04_04570 [Bdellovibrionales bacterium]|nr:hypothetical protein [Bdellovibrionales bacterium]
MIPVRRGSPLLDEQVAAGLRGDFQRGWEIAEELARTTPDCHRAAFNRAWYEMMRGNLLQGLKLLDSGRWERAFGDPPLPTNKPIYRNENLEGRHVLLCSEGGYGDEIINVRFAKDFADRGAKVTVTCDNALKSVFSRVPGVAAVVGHKAAPEVYHDFWVPAMSAARVLEKEYATLSGAPYLSVAPEYRAKWKELFARNFSESQRPRIGLRFYGNPQFEHEQHRKFPKEGLLQAIGARSWVSLQKEETPLPLETWEDTLAVIDQLDLVITSCTSVAHAAAGLGKETWVIVPILPYYVWAYPGTKSPWYDSVRLFRQKKFGEWDVVFAEVAEALKARGL